MKKILKIVLLVLIIFIILGVGGVYYLSRGLEVQSKVTINDANLSLLSDGIYNGKYQAGRWTNKVNVTIKDHKITNINIVKDVLFSKEEVTKDLIDRVIEEQKINVDTITGATVTSKAYLKAIENALKEK